MPADTYGTVVNTPVGRFVARRAGLPRPVELERHSPGDPVIRGRVLLGAAPGPARLTEALARILASAGAESATSLEQPVRSAAAAARLDAAVFNADAPGDQRFKALVFDATGIADSTQLVALQRFKALVFDATGIADSPQLVALQRFFHPTIRRIETSGRVFVLGTPPRACATPRAATAQRALEGFTRSLGKEVGRGATVQLVEVAPGAEDQIDSTVRFLLSPRSAYVSGQVVRITPSPLHPEVDRERPLLGRVALVTGAARGIGAAIADVLARDGARVVGLDVPALGDELRATAQRV